MENRSEVLLLVMCISGVIVLAGLGYLWTFWMGFGNDFVMSPLDNSGGIQLSPRECGSFSCPYVNPALCNILC